MNKYIEVFCKQNKTMEIKCLSCGKTHRIDSSTFFTGRQYELSCENCGVVSTYETDKAVKDFEKTMKSMGIQVK